MGSILLVGIEEDGKVEYSDIVHADYLEKEFIANIYPNPSRNDIYMSLNSKKETEGILQLINILVETILKKNTFWRR